MESFLHDLGHVASVFDQEVVFHDGPGDAHCIAFLKSIQTNGRCGHLATDDDHGDAVHVCRSNAGHRIGQAGPGGDQRHTDFAGRTGKAVGRVHRRLFVAHQHVLDGVLFVKRVVDVQHSTTRVTPDVLHVFSLKRFDEDFCAAQLLSAHRWRCRFGFVHFHIQPL